MKKIINTGAGLIFLLCFCLLVPVRAFGQGYGSSTVVGEQRPDRLVDDARLLDSEESQKLRSQLDEVSERQQCDVVVVTVNSLEGMSAGSFADDYYDYHGYGMGEDDDGILFLISMSERKWAISTYGSGITAFTDAGQEYMMKKIRPDLSDGDYYNAFITYAKLADDFLTQAADGEAYDEGHMPVTASDIGFCVIVGLIGGFLLALLRVYVMKMQMRTVYSQCAAANYLEEDSIRFQERSDRLVRKTVNKIYIEPEKSHGGGSGGGSTVHTSSSGRSHGGSSGSF